MISSRVCCEASQRAPSWQKAQSEVFGFAVSARVVDAIFVLESVVTDASLSGLENKRQTSVIS